MKIRRSGLLDLHEAVVARAVFEEVGQAGHGLPKSASCVGEERFVGALLQVDGRSTIGV
jgi:hypothetical protein